MKEEKSLKAIDVALNNELLERDFYYMHAERTKNPVGKAMFKRIGDDELEHYEMLKQLHEKWTKEGKWPETVPLEVQDTKIKDVLKDVMKKVEKKTQTDSDDLEAIRTAIDFEYKGVQFYKDLADMVSDPKEKQFFLLLSGIEKEHALSLQDAEEYFTDPESYFRKMEHHSLDGS